MNTAPAATARPRAPFAAVLHFKPMFLYQGKWNSFAFRSDDLSPEHTPPAAQYSYLENYVLHGLKNQYWDASLFENLGVLKIPPHLPAARHRNLVWKANHFKFTIDNRPFLDLSFLDHTYTPGFADQLQQSFNAPVLPIAEVDKLYNEMFNQAASSIAGNDYAEGYKNFMG